MHALLYITWAQVTNQLFKLRAFVVRMKSEHRNIMFLHRTLTQWVSGFKTTCRGADGGGCDCCCCVYYFKSAACISVFFFIRMTYLFACVICCLWYSGSALDCWPTGCTIDPAPGTWFITIFTSFAKVVPGPVYPYSSESWPKTSFIHLLSVLFMIKKIYLVQLILLSMNNIK